MANRLGGSLADHAKVGSAEGVERRELRDRKQRAVSDAVRGVGDVEVLGVTSLTCHVSVGETSDAKQKKHGGRGYLDQGTASGEQGHAVVSEALAAFN
eukprot:3305127-Rhodomonas_salina.1